VGLSPQQRRQHFVWIPERALEILSYVADGDDGDGCDYADHQAGSREIHSTNNDTKVEPIPLSQDWAHFKTGNELFAAAAATPSTMGANSMPFEGNQFLHDVPSAASAAITSTEARLHNVVSSEAPRVLGLSNASDKSGQRQLCWHSDWRGHSAPQKEEPRRRETTKDRIEIDEQDWRSSCRESHMCDGGGRGSNEGIAHAHHKAGKAEGGRGAQPDRGGEKGIRGKRGGRGAHGGRGGNDGYGSKGWRRGSGSNGRSAARSTPAQAKVLY